MTARNAQFDYSGCYIYDDLDDGIWFYTLAAASVNSPSPFTASTAVAACCGALQAWGNTKSVYCMIKAGQVQLVSIYISNLYRYDDGMCSQPCSDDPAVIATHGLEDCGSTPDSPDAYWSLYSINTSL